MRGYRKKTGDTRFSVPLVGASLFFIISLFLFASYKNSAYQQAKRKSIRFIRRTGRLIWMRCIRTV